MNKLGENGLSNDEQIKSRPLLNKRFHKASGQRDAVSDDDEEVHAKQTVVRKAQMLDIDNSDDEFMIKSGC